jgi:GDPmannose 4,6-dehydratase
VAPIKTALITGVTGQDGSYMADLLLEKDYRVVGLLRRSSTTDRPNLRHLSGRVELEFGDLLDASALTRILADVRPDEIYNFAAQSAPADSWRQTILTAEITALGVVRLLDAARALSLDPRVYQASTREIFGGVRASVYDESTPMVANNPYAVAKLYAHQMAATYREAYDMHVAAGILFNHESPRRGLQFVSRKITTAAACIKLGVDRPPEDEQGRPLVRDGKVRLGYLGAQRDWGFAPEYVEAAWRMLQRDEPKDYVIATNSLYSVEDLCRVAFERVDLDWRDHVEVSDALTRPTEIAAARGDYSLAKSELGWEPQVGFVELVNTMVDADVERWRRGRAEAVASAR